MFFDIFRISKHNDFECLGSELAFNVLQERGWRWFRLTLEWVFSKLFNCMRWTGQYESVILLWRLSGLPGGVDPSAQFEHLERTDCCTLARCQKYCSYSEFSYKIFSKYFIQKARKVSKLIKSYTGIYLLIQYNFKINFSGRYEVESDMISITSVRFWFIEQKLW